MAFHTPQIIYALLCVLELYAMLNIAEKQKTFYIFYAALVGNALFTGLLYWGGFFGGC